jgi:flagellar protein FliS
MLSAHTMRGKFRDGAIETASNERVIVMAFDRIDRDLAEAVQGLEDGDADRTHRTLCHAQALISELQHMLDLEVWEHAQGLFDLYDYMIRRLVAANIVKDVVPVVEVQGLVRDLGDAFRGAAREVMSRPSAAPALSRVG